MYQVLARKYRPKNFHELVGQTHVSQALINAIEHNRLHHAYLFTGTRGVGKTTIARILSKCLNCETGVTSMPCNQCSACVAIDAGRFIDLIEVDAASRTRVEDTREILDNVPFAPSQGRYKVYLIDEVHMLSTHSFNALLKTLEEPPAHVKFLLATTDPQKIPITIISRCLQFVLRPQPRHSLVTHLQHVLTQEQIEYEDAALYQLADAAKGSVRDALSLTDQAISVGANHIAAQDIQHMLGLVDTSNIMAILGYLAQGERHKVSQLIVQLRQQVVDAAAILDKLAEYLHQLALCQALPDIDLELSPIEQDQLQALTEQIESETLQLYYEIVINSRERLHLANTPMQGLEMCLLRMLAFRPLPPQQMPQSPPTSESGLDAQTQVASQPHYNDTGNDIKVQAQDDSTHLATATSGVLTKDTDVASPDDESSTNRLLANSSISHNHLNSDQESDALEATVVQEQSDMSTASVTEPEMTTTTIASQTDTTSSNVAPLIDDVLVAQDEDTISSAVATAPIEHEQSLAPNEWTDSTPNEDIAVTESTPASTATDSQASSMLDYDNRHNSAPQAHHVQSPRTSLVTLAELERDGDALANPISALRQQLYCPEVDIAGEWTLEKWECWITQTNLNAMERSIALAGVMQGDINAQNNQFLLPKGYDFTEKTGHRTLLEKFRHDFPNSQVTPVYTEAMPTTPHQAIEHRYQQSIKLAESLLHQEPVLQLLSEYDKIRLNNIELKI